MLWKECSNGSFWLLTVLTDPDKPRPLFPQQPTSSCVCLTSLRLRLLLGGKRTYGKAACGVRS
jgi:hypothetical protein